MYKMYIGETFFASLTIEIESKHFKSLTYLYLYIFVSVLSSLFRLSFFLSSSLNSFMHLTKPISFLCSYVIKLKCKWQQCIFDCVEVWKKSGAKSFNIETSFRYHSYNTCLSLFQLHLCVQLFCPSFKLREW